LANLTARKSSKIYGQKETEERIESRQMGKIQIHITLHIFIRNKKKKIEIKSILTTGSQFLSL